MKKLLLHLLTIPIFATAQQQMDFFTIGIGSCSKQSKDLGILSKVVEKKPDLFLWMGDNIYGDTYDMQVLEEKYKALVNNPYFQTLKKTTPMLSVWDDHDYGWNDAGKEYPEKEASRKLFLKYWEVKNPDRINNPDGIFGVEYIHHKNRKIQIILLDTRFNRDVLTKYQKGMPFGKNDYIPTDEPTRTFLGETQWKWLEQILKEKADLRIIVSSIQFSHEYNGWESWTNFPAQQQRMMDLIRTTHAENLFFVSGDVHWGELSSYTLPGQYPIYDFTSSGLTEKWPSIEPNKNRIKNAVRDPNYGIIRWDGENSIEFNLYNHLDQRVFTHEINLKELKFK